MNKQAQVINQQRLFIAGQLAAIYIVTILVFIGSALLLTIFKHLGC